MNLESKIEALLFYKNEPLPIGEIGKLLNESEDQIKIALTQLDQSLKNRGLCLIRTEKLASLATNPDLKDLIDQIAKDEMSKDIGKASLETLAIVLYNGPVSRREVDYIRGVNSTFILRNLTIRGLIEKEENLKDQRVIKYRASISLLAHLGIKTKDELPEFVDFQKKLSDLKNLNTDE
jgi:segregation and condensation protein B